MAIIRSVQRISADWETRHESDETFVTGRVLNSTDELPSSTRSPIDVVREEIDSHTGTGGGGFGGFAVDEESNGVTESDVRETQWESGNFSTKTSGRKNVTVSLVN